MMDVDQKIKDILDAGQAHLKKNNLEKVVDCYYKARRAVGDNRKEVSPETIWDFRLFYWNVLVPTEQMEMKIEIKTLTDKMNAMPDTTTFERILIHSAKKDISYHENELELHEGKQAEMDMREQRKEVLEHFGLPLT